MKERKTSELTASSIANAIGIVLFNTVPLWRQYTQGVVLEDFVRILWAANLSFLVQIAGNLSLMFYRPPRFAALVQILATSAGLLSLIVFYVVFPLDFSQVGVAWLNSALRIVLIVGMVGAVIGLIVQTVKLAVSWRRFEYDTK
ncbi:MAG: hypothetical protein ABSG85_12820 [Spirochaetia bacterium]|jgi:hypothetical protein